MINPKNNGNALSLAVSIAATLTENKRILLSRFPNSPVYVVQSAMQPPVSDLQAGPYDDLTIDGINEVNDKFTSFNEESDALQEGEFRDLVVLVAGGIKNTLAKAREQVVPVVKAGVDWLAAAPDDSLGNNIDVIETPVNTFHDDIAGAVVEYYDSKVLNSKFASVLLNNEQLAGWREAILNNNGQYSSENLAGLFAELTDDDMADVRQWLFTDRQLTVQSNPLFAQRYYGSLNKRLLAYLTVCWLEFNPVEGAGVSLAEWENIFLNLRMMTGIALSRSYKERGYDRNRGLMVLDHSALATSFGGAHLSVTVNPDLYGSYLADGDANSKIEAILGSTLTQNGLITIEYLDVNRAELVKKWQNHVLDHRASYVSQRVRRTRNSLRVFLLGLEGVPTDVRESLVRRNDWRDLMETALLRIDGDSINNPWRMVGDLVCDVLFDEQSKALLQSMREIGDSMPDAGPREVAAIAANRALGTWLAGQVSVFTFDPTTPDDRNY